MKLGELIRKWRLVTERSVRDVGKEIGISASTLSRVERGEVMDGDTLAKILTWALQKEKAA